VPDRGYLMAIKPRAGFKNSARCDGQSPAPPGGGAEGHTATFRAEGLPSAPGQSGTPGFGFRMKRKAPPKRGRYILEGKSKTISNALAEEHPLLSARSQFGSR